MQIGKNRVIVLTIVVFFFVIISCQSENRMSVLVNNNIIIFIGQPVDEVITKLGIPQKERVASKSTVSEDDLITIEYPGILLTFIRSGRIIQRIEIIEKYSFIDITIGEEIQEVRKKLNNYTLESESEHESNYYLSYVFKSDLVFIVTFTITFNNNKVVSIILNSSWPS